MANGPLFATSTDPEDQDRERAWSTAPKMRGKSAPIAASLLRPMAMRFFAPSGCPSIYRLQVLTPSGDRCSLPTTNRQGQNSMSSRALKRAVRSAAALEHGEDMLALVMSKAAVTALRNTADKGIPAVSAVSDALFERFGEYTKLPPVKTFIGQCVRAALEQEGYEVIERNVRLRNDKIFNRGTVYAKAHQEGESTKVKNAIRVQLQLSLVQANELLAQLEKALRASRARQR
jgi:hypothetical protein